MKDVEKKINETQPSHIDFLQLYSHVDSSKHLFVNPSTEMMHNPARVKHVYVMNTISWTQLGLLMQHFILINNTYPQPKNNQQVFDVLKSRTWEDDQGLLLPVWPEADDERNYTAFSDGSLRPMPGMENINSLMVYNRVNYIPVVFQLHLWPEIRYLYLSVKMLNATQILALKETAPKLKYLELQFDPDDISNLV